LVDGLVGDQDTASHHHLFDLPQAQREAVIQPHTVTDDLHREPVPLEQRRRGIHEPILTHPHHATEHPNPVNLMTVPWLMQVNAG
jgi:hypothetical protein